MTECSRWESHGHSHDMGVWVNTRGSRRTDRAGPSRREGNKKRRKGQSRALSAAPPRPRSPRGCRPGSPACAGVCIPPYPQPQGGCCREPSGASPQRPYPSGGGCLLPPRPASLRRPPPRQARAGVQPRCGTSNSGARRGIAAERGGAAAASPAGLRVAAAPRSSVLLLLAPSPPGFYRGRR